MLAVLSGLEGKQKRAESCPVTSLAGEQMNFTEVLGLLAPYHSVRLLALLWLDGSGEDSCKCR